MLQVFASVAIIFSILVIAEQLQKRNILPKEIARKLPHIAAGLGVATWPFLISYEAIIGLSLLFLFSAFVVKQLGLFQGVRSVKRISWGEFFFPIGVIVVSLFSPDNWVFAVAVLHLGLADGVAAVIGSRYGKRHSYTIFGQKKSLEGSLAFMAVSFVITIWVLNFTPADIDSISPWVVASIPLATTLIENFAVFGTDNLFVPILVVAMLTP